jgi:hypothetical protein
VYCGVIGNGCGGTLDCGTCAGGATCGGGGLDHVCGGAPNCVPVTCNAQGGGEYCGVIGNGCGGVLDCTECADGAACGGEIANVCPGTGGPGCTKRQCDVAQCPDGGTTSLSGTVYDPAGVNPIYNAVVYVPNDDALDEIPTGAACDRCGATASGNPVTATLTDTQGRFVLKGVPTGKNVPLVVQVGKWRRVATIANVPSCVDTPVAKDAIRLPRTQAEGHLPLIAMSTGNADALECLLRRIGIADSEFTTDTGGGRVHLYAGGIENGEGEGTKSFNGGAAFPRATSLWSSTAKMAGYDMLLLSCEGASNGAIKDPYLGNMETYLNAGGRVFFSHMHFYWLREGSAAVQDTATYIGAGDKLPEPVTGFINTTFPKGAALADWFYFVNQMTVPRGQLVINKEGQHSVTAVKAPTQDWITVPANPGGSGDDKEPAIQYMTFNTPLAAAEDAKCGRAVFTDLHINSSAGTAGGDNSDPGKPFPTECKTNGLTPQGQVLEFMFYDLSSCVMSDTGQPEPPNPPPPPGSPPPPHAPPAPSAPSASAAPSPAEVGT